jgi:hypothetical protein
MTEKNIVNRLRTDSSVMSWQTANEAADLIEKLQEQVEIANQVINIATRHIQNTPNPQLAIMLLERYRRQYGVDT